MKYTKKKSPNLGSKAAVEVKRILDKQDPPLGYADAADIIGVHQETMRTIVNDSRPPSAGVINGLGRALHLSDREVNHLFALLKEDREIAKLRKITGAEAGGNLNFADLYSTLSQEQRELLLRSALKFAQGNERTTR